MALLNKNTVVATEHKDNNNEDDSNLVSSSNLAGTLSCFKGNFKYLDY